MIIFFNIPNSTGYYVKNNTEYGVTFADSSLNRLVTPIELETAKRAKSTVDIDTITATKIAGLFGKEPHSIELIVKQQNAQARVSELQEREAAGLKRLTELQDIEISGGTLNISELTEKTALLSGVLTAAEQTEKTATQNAFTLIKLIRAHGKQLQTDLATADPDTFDINAGWPV